MSGLQNWSVTAVNLPDHADNIIHTDAGAQAAGFTRALVAGTTVYAYLTHPLVVGWGLDWLSGGGGELRLRKPVFDEDPVLIAIDEETTTLTAEVGSDGRATLEAWSTTTAPAIRSGEAMEPVEIVLGQEHLDYGARAGDDLSIYAEENIAHPVTWANLANAVFKENLVTGPWIHTRSRIHHEGVASIGSTVRAESVLIERFDSRAGERALVDMRLLADDVPVATIEHEAIIVLPGPG